MFYSNEARVASPQFAGQRRPHPQASCDRASTPSLSAACCQRLGGAAWGAGDVSQRNRSSAAAIAAASSGEALAPWISICGRGGWRLPFLSAMASTYLAVGRRPLPGRLLLLVLHAEADVRIGRRLGHPDPLQLDPIRSEPVEEPDASAEEHRDDADADLWNS